MGGILSRRVGSDPYYADYERVFKRLRAEMERLHKRRFDRKQTLDNVATAVFRYGSIGFVLAVVLAAWVQQQPDGTFTTREHSLLVLPMFLEPALAYLLYEVCHHFVEWRDSGDINRLKMLEGKLRKMITTLKDSTRFAKTQKLLEAYDPDYTPPVPKLPPPGRNTPMPRQTPGGGKGSATPQTGTARRGGARGISLLPAFDRLAAGIMGDNPSLMEALRTAEAEAIGLRNRLATAEQWVRELAHENAFLKAQLGQPPPLLLEGPSAEARPGQGLGPGRGGLPSTEAHPSSVEEPETPAAQRPGSHVSGNPLTVAERVQLYRSLTEGTEPALQGPARRRSCSDSPSPSPSRPSSSPVAKARKLFGDAAQSCGAEGDPGDSERSDHGQGVATSPGEEVSAPVSLLDGASGGLDRPTSAADEEADSRSAETRDVAEKEDERRRGGVEGGVGQGEQRQGECVGSGKGDEVSGTGEEGADGPVVAVPKETKQLGVHEISAHTTNGSPETTPSPPS